MLAEALNGILHHYYIIHNATEIFDQVSPDATTAHRRYLISVEGNDVATGLKWMLYSNSVVFMPPPTKETRFREGSLVPWLHYVPLAEDFTDLIEKIQFCDNYVFICQKVAEMSTEFARQRIIKENEADDVNANIFKNYLDMYDINVVNKACDVEVDCVE